MVGCQEYFLRISIFFSIFAKDLLLVSSYRSRRISALPQLPMKRLRIEVKGPGQYTISDFSPPISNNTEKLLHKQNTQLGFDFDDQEMKKLNIWEQGIIPYYIDNLSFDKVLRDKIRLFLDMTNSVAGVRFMELPQPPTDDKTRWVFFINRRGLLGCADYSMKNFTNQGVQKVMLGYDCISNKDMAEAVLVIVGVPPQHNAPNRDDYIEVNMENIQPEKRYLFNKVQNNEWLFHEVPYDFNSASHYSLHKYTINGAATIIPKVQHDKKEQKLVEDSVGQNDGYSFDDIRKMRMLYNFISRKKLNSFKVPDCQKLFEPGSNFSNFQPVPISEVLPLKKPNTYLGLPDDEPQEADENGNMQEEKLKMLDTDELIKQNSESHTVELNADKMKNEKQVLKYYAGKNKLKDPLTVLSDFQTDEEEKRKPKKALLRFTSLKKTTNFDK